MNRRDGEEQVSVVITCYNQARFLAEAIRSVLGQERPCDELIVVDDGSTDDTRDVTSRYGAARYIYQQNQGLAAARNAGIRETRGQFLVFLDADDRLTPDAIFQGVSCFSDNPESAFVFGRFNCFAENGASAQTPAQPPCPSDPYVGLLEGNFVGMHATVMYRRSALVETGGFDVSLPVCEDYAVYLEIARAHPIASHDAVVAEYRKHSANLSNNSGLMLRHVLSLLRRQEALVANDPGKVAACKKGLRAWRQYYGRELVNAARASFSQRRRLAGLRHVLTLVRYAPGELFGQDFNLLRVVLKRIMWLLPVSVRGSLQTRWVRASYLPKPGSVRLGDLRRLIPVSRRFGFDRGSPIDRYYIERFLTANAACIAGRVLEVGGSEYTRRFGGEKVASSDVLHIDPDHPAATIVADLAAAEHVPSERFDCIVLTQTLHLIFDLDAAIKTLYRILKPGGVLLATVPGTISQVGDEEWRSAWCWGVTPLAAERLMSGVFDAEQLEISSYGNVLTGTAFLQGLAAEELLERELEYRDELYPLVVTIRAVKPRSGDGGRQPEHGP